MTRKHIWIVNFHTAPPGYALNPRYIKMVPFLEQKGYDVTIISSSYLRRFDKDLISNKKCQFEKAVFDKINFLFIKTPPYKGNGFKRIISICIFSFKLLWYKNKIRKPDIIYHNLHTPFDSAIYLVSRLLKSKYISEVWDLWPEFFWKTGLISKRNPLLKLSYQVEKYLYSKSDAIVFTFKGGYDYIISKGWQKIIKEKIHYVTNGIDLHEYSTNLHNYKIVDPELDDNKKFKVVYIGTLNKVNNVSIIIEAAKILKENKDIVFLIYGDGEYRKCFQEECIEQSIDNVIIKDKYIQFHLLPYILSKSSLNLLLYQRDFGQYGISPGKLPLYLASGKPILSNINVNHCLITKNNLGISREIIDGNEFAQVVLSFKNMKKEDYNAICSRVISSSKEFDYSNLTEQLLKIFASLE